MKSRVTAKVQHFMENYEIEFKKIAFVHPTNIQLINFIIISVTKINLNKFYCVDGKTRRVCT